MKRRRPADERGGRPAARGVRRAAVTAAGWASTVVGVLVILVVLGGGGSGPLSESGPAILAVAVVMSVLVPAALGIAYLLVRSRNRAAEGTGGRTPVAPRARAAQTTLAALLDRVDGDDALGMRRVVLGDRVELTASNLSIVDDRWDALSVIWTVRPAQAADFPRSPRFHGLPGWAQNAVVLLDLRRDLQLRGAAVSLTADSGFYHHPFDRTLQAAARTGSAELTEALLAARQAADGARPPGDRRRDGDPHTRPLLALLDDGATWERVLD